VIALAVKFLLIVKLARPSYLLCALDAKIRLRERLFTENMRTCNPEMTSHSRVTIEKLTIVEKPNQRFRSICLDFGQAFARLDSRLQNQVTLNVLHKLIHLFSGKG
jgi:hypothetical protein